MDMYFGYEFAFPVCMVSPSTTVQGLIEGLIHWHGILCNIASDQRTPLFSKGGL